MTDSQLVTAARAKISLPPAPTTSQRPAVVWSRLLLAGCAIGLASALAFEAGRIFVGSNLHVVLPGRVYRSAQPSGADVERRIRDLGIRTIVNLRGTADPASWYLEEARATHQGNVAQEDIRFSAGHLPSPNEVRRFLQVLERSEYPVLLHCRRGSDRTGVASAIVLLLQTSQSVTEAEHQLGLRYGHVAVGRPAFLNGFLGLYKEFLREKGLTHTPEHFREWIEHGYCPAECRCLLERIDWPSYLKKDEACGLRVRVENTSVRNWRFAPGSNAGIHAELAILDERGILVATARGGMFHAEVPPQQSIELVLPVPPIHHPGRYLLQVDMVDEQHCEFHQAGSDILEEEIEVR